LNFFGARFSYIYMNPTLRKIKTAGIISLWSIVLFCLLVMGTMYLYGYSATDSDQQPRVVEIPQGATLKRTAHLLADHQVINSPTSFIAFTYLQGKQNQIQAGEYELSATLPPQEILKKITQGETLDYAVTIPEGYRISEIAELLAQKGLVDKNRFINETRNAELIDSLNIPTRDLEGYLFPETYRFRKNAGEKKIVQAMVAIFKQKADLPEFRERARKLNLTLHEIITLASLIEKETGLASERKIISSVFHNRLKKRMRLQTDPSVIYALADFDGNIRKKDLSIDSPYNTYLYFGLPPGPIANPGLDSILSALEPAQTDMFYFVSRQNGSHQFSANLTDHNRAVRKYQLRRQHKG